MTRDKRPQLSGQNKTDLMPNNASCKRWDTLILTLRVPFHKTVHTPGHLGLGGVLNRGGALRGPATAHRRTRGGERHADRLRRHTLPGLARVRINHQRCYVHGLKIRALDIPQLAQIGIVPARVRRP